jgi:hypothetical protein
MNERLHYTRIVPNYTIYRRSLNSQGGNDHRRPEHRERLSVGDRSSGSRKKRRQRNRHKCSSLQLINQKLGSNASVCWWP